jgi:hypothetical protein
VVAAFFGVPGCHFFSPFRVGLCLERFRANDPRTVIYLSCLARFYSPMAPAKNQKAFY